MGRPRRKVVPGSLHPLVAIYCSGFPRTPRNQDPKSKWECISLPWQQPRLITTQQCFLRSMDHYQSHHVSKPRNIGHEQPVLLFLSQECFELHCCVTKQRLATYLSTSSQSEAGNPANFSFPSVDLWSKCLASPRSGTSPFFTSSPSFRSLRITANKDKSDSKSCRGFYSLTAQQH